MAISFQARRLEGEIDSRLWLQLWRECHRPAICQHPAYWRALAADGTTSAVVLGLWEGTDEAPTAVIPFLQAPARLGGFSWLHPSTASFGGLLVREFDLPLGESVVRDLLAAIAAAVPSALARAMLVLPPGWLDARALAWSGWTVAPHYNYLSRLARASDLLAQAADSTRRQARKARRAGLQLSVEGSIDSLLELRAKTEARQGFHDAVSPAAYRALARIADDADAHADGLRAAVLCIRDEAGRLLAGGLFTADGHRSYYAMGASDPQALDTGAASLLHIEAVAYFEREGWPLLYDWCGANDPGVARFKKGFRPELEVLLRAERSSTAVRVADLARGLRRPRRTS